ncbi:MAG: carbon-nitrogen hydrolase family protein [Ottowia sp.]|nr:carbon-nitrogen hydrolase family protein [Ottowia sp.]
MKLAAIQMVSSTSLADNLRVAHALLTEAAHHGAELAVLPEYFCVLGRRDTDKLALQEALGNGPIQDWLAATARELGLWIVGGTLPLSCNDGSAAKIDVGSAASAPLAGSAAREAAQPGGPCLNASLAFAPTGERVARYDKIHLFRFDDGTRVYDEAAVLVAGHMPTLFELPSRDGHTWKVGMSVCYDLRFPELYRHYAAQGADLLLVPSAFTYVTGSAHWEVLLRARAIENLCGVVAAAQGGTHENGRRTWGHSMVVDAWGQVLNVRPEGGGVVLAELLPHELAARRAALPALSHRVL